MLVDLYIQTELIRDHPFIEIPVVELRCDLRVAIAVGQIDAQMRVVPGIRVSLLAEMIESHRLSPIRRRLAAVDRPLLALAYEGSDPVGKYARLLDVGIMARIRDRVECRASDEIRVARYIVAADNAVLLAPEQ